jgi:hypothetical protein
VLSLPADGVPHQISRYTAFDDQAAEVCSPIPSRPGGRQVADMARPTYAPQRTTNFDQNDFVIHASLHLEQPWSAALDAQGPSKD